MFCTESQLKAICNPTRLKILGLLAEKDSTTTELFQKLGLNNRESVFKALKKLKQTGLVKLEHKHTKGYKYSLNFKQLELGHIYLGFDART